MVINIILCAGQQLDFKLEFSQVTNALMMKVLYI
jgi:hypothetical protein